MRFTCTEEFARAGEETVAAISQAMQRSRSVAPIAQLLTIAASTVSALEQQNQQLTAALDRTATLFGDAFLREKGFDPQQFTEGRIDRDEDGKPCYVATERPGAPVVVPVPQPEPKE